MSRPNSILIFGATGVIGKFITGAIVNAQPAFDKVSIFTSQNTIENKKSEVEALKAKGVNFIVGDLTKDEDVLKAYEGVDTVISALGRNTILEQISLLRLATTHPTVSWFFPSEYGTDIEFGPSSPVEKPHQNKLKVRKYIRENIYDEKSGKVMTDGGDAGLKVTYLVTGPYADMFYNLIRNGGEGAGGYDVTAKKAVLVGESGDGKVALTTMKDVGALLVASLNNPTASQNRILLVNSFVTTPREILAEIQKQTSTTDAEWDITYTPLPQLKELEEKVWSEGKPWATGVTLRRIWGEGGTLYDGGLKNDDGVVGMDGKTETLEGSVKGWLAAAK